MEDQKEASQTYNRGYYGAPQSGGSLKLDLIESTFLLESGKISVKKKSKEMDLESLINYATSIDTSFEIKYLVYRDLRQRGYVVKTGKQSTTFYVFQRGDIPTKTEPKYIVSAMSERAKCNIKEFSNLLDISSKEKKEFLFAIVDEEGDLTYYSASYVPMSKGACSGKKTNENFADTAGSTAVFLHDRVLVWDDNAAKKLHEQEAYGKPIGKGLQLSLIETMYLMRNPDMRLNTMDVKTNEKISAQSFRSKAKKIQSDFDICIAAYEDLRRRGFLPKTGFKYGSHFRVYDGNLNEQHARYLVHAIPENFECTWPEISRAVRLAHSVRKQMIFARIGKNKIRYIQISRVRP
jgi:tRNA-intron endonuclease